jgi:hypothetical protein
VKTLAKMYSDQYRAVEAAVESWRADHDEAMAVREFEEMIRICLGLQDGTRKLVHSAWDAGFSGRVRDPESGKYILQLLEAGVEVSQALARAAEACAAQGHIVEGADKIPPSLAEIRALHADFAARWPFVRKEDVERGAKEIAAGKSVTGEELLRELQGSSS